ncbi:hydrogenase maturation protease [Bacteroidota bacterium]
MESKREKIIVLGFGNEILTDDGIGVRIVKKIQNEEIFSSMSFDVGWLGGMEILDFIENYDTAVFIDAIRTKDGSPGDVYHFTPGDFLETLHLSNVHDTSFENTIKMGRKLGMVIPDTIHVLAVEIVEDLVFSKSFSPKVEKKYPEILDYIRRFLSSLIK